MKCLDNLKLLLHKASLVRNPWTCRYRWRLPRPLTGGTSFAPVETRSASKGSILFMLVTWLIWKEWPHFQQEKPTPTQLLNRTKEEAELWCQAGAKALSTLGVCSFQDQARSLTVTN
ncbi:hypothetical protein PAHAL_7G154200 [Panicum hallii]|uniref:Uncharacterized protein n=1 Tax=Panicum hallii TaxID=206008 RepID=A0A2S3I6Q6_9POAL|nr:hypothetical protein PAHAL_7G154200 [Panicum hallii]